MRSEKQFAVVLTMALGIGAGAHVWAQQQHSNATPPATATTSHSTVAPASHAEAPQAAPSISKPSAGMASTREGDSVPQQRATQTTSPAQHVDHPFMTPRQVPRPPEHNNTSTMEAKAATTHEGEPQQAPQAKPVPRPPANQRPIARSPRTYATPHSVTTPARANDAVGSGAARQGGSVPRPPDRTATSAAGNAQAPANGNVPRPPQTNSPMVGNAKPPAARAPVIGTPRDVHQGPHAGDWLRRYNTLPPAQRQRALENDPVFRRLSPQEQQHYRNQLNQFSSKSPQDQQRLINRMDAWGHLSQQQKEQARTTYAQLKAMPADRQQQVNAAFRRLRAMPPSARQQVISSPEFQSRYNEQERAVIQNMTEINSSLPH